MTSHDVVARARRALGTRKIGHAGTLDPMATGLLILGVEGATRLLTFIVGLDKTYEATIRLGVATDTDDAEGEIETVSGCRGPRRADRAITAAIAALTGRDLAGAEHACRRSRSAGGAHTTSHARAPRSSSRRARSPSRGSRCSPCGATDGVVDLDVVVDCSSGTYIRALARDLGAALGVGGHLTALRRTRIGPFDVAGRGIRRRSRAAPLARARRRRRRRARPPRRHRRRGARPAPRQAARRRGSAARSECPPPRSTRRAPSSGIVERRGDDVKSVMNMPEEAVAMILWFTYVAGRRGGRGRAAVRRRWGSPAGARAI